MDSPVPKSRFKRPLDTRDRERERDRYPDVSHHQSRTEVESRAARASVSDQANHDINHPEPSSGGVKKSTKTKDILQLSDDDDDDGDLLASSDTEIELAEMLGEKVSTLSYRI